MTEVMAALVREQSVNFAVVMVTEQSLRQPDSSKNRLASSMSTLFPGTHVVLCAQDRAGTPTYWGRTDIVRFLSGLHISQLPWRKYRTAA